ncbi:MAG TPA: hypothetical protein PLF81_25960 [Candidatus Anammoximicrobium sp.]|nr:hypothetical protein [Candidatus Anammoximicrobium sp.]
MSRSKMKSSAAVLDELLNEASWLLSHAEALSDYGRVEEAAGEWARAANCEEAVACLLDAAQRGQEAAVHRVSGASCYARLGEPARAVTLLRAALSAPLPDDYRSQIERQLADVLAETQRGLRQRPLRKTREKSPAVR